MIRGRAEAAGATPDVPLAAQTRVVRALAHLTIAVGAAGVVCAAYAQVVDSGALPQVGVATGDDPSGGVSTETALVLGVVEDPAASRPAPVAASAPEVVALDTAQATLVSAETVVALTVTETVEIPAPTPGTAAPAPGGSAVEAIQAVFGEHAQEAVNVARCESGLNQAAVSRGGGNWGLFQINKVHRGRVAAMGFAWEDLLDPRVNSLVAKSIFDEQGWRPWACRRAA